jgi:hypothetical protein
MHWHHRHRPGWEGIAFLWYSVFWETSAWEGEIHVTSKVVRVAQSPPCARKFAVSAAPPQWVPGQPQQWASEGGH